MDIIIAPISGCYFVNQLGAYKNLLEYNFKPEIFLGASGGIIGIMLLACSGNNVNGLLSVSKKLNSKYLIKDWNSFLPAGFMSLLKGSFYQHSELHHNILEMIATPGLMKEKEIWLNCFNIGKGKTSLYCTCEKNTTILEANDCDIFLTEVYHANGNLKIISDAILASSAVPILIPSVNLNDEPHFDGGLSFATPFLLLRDSIISNYKKTKKAFHMILSNPFDLENIRNINLFDVIDKGKISVTLMIKSSIMIERHNAKQVLMEVKENKEILKMENVSLDYYFLNKKYWRASLLECYPTTEIQLNFHNFTGENLVDKINECSKIISYRLWFVEL
jgi:hypothetical protein